MCCLNLFDQLFPEVKELNAVTLHRLEAMQAEEPECDPGGCRRPITLETIRAMSERHSDLRFMLFSPHLLFDGGKPRARSAEEGQEEAREADGDSEEFDELNSTWRDEEGEETSSNESSSCISDMESEEEANEPTGGALYNSSFVYISRNVVKQN